MTWDVFTGCFCIGLQSLVFDVDVLMLFRQGHCMGHFMNEVVYRAVPVWSQQYTHRLDVVFCSRFYMGGYLFPVNTFQVCDSTNIQSFVDLFVWMLMVPYRDGVILR